MAMFLYKVLSANFHGMQPVVCYLRKDIIWDSRTTNNQKEAK
jgi:hypothetical protein